MIPPRTVTEQEKPAGLQELKRKLRTYARCVLGRQPAGRALTVFPDDTFIVSYPRSGNTWTRFLVGNLLHPDDPMTFLKMDQYIPPIYRHPDRHLRRFKRPRILKSHECFDPRYRRVIYIVRDPRDVACSSYYFHIKMRKTSEDEPLEHYVSRWLDSDVGDLFALFGNWQEHVQSWLASGEGQPGFLLLRFEDMKKDTQSELAKIAAYLDIEASPARLARAVELSSPARMREAEASERHKWFMTRRSRPDVPFVRSAVAGDWRAMLAKTSVMKIESVFGDLMQHLGYELSAAAGSAAASEFEPSTATSR